MLETPKVDKGMVIRVAIFLLALINQGLVASGHSPLPFDSADTTLFVSWLWTTVSGLWAAWKNNPFTKKARRHEAKKHY